MHLKIDWQRQWLVQRGSEIISEASRHPSRNPYRHGLSTPLQSDPSISAKVDTMARALAGEQASGTELASAAVFARARFELLRIPSLRNEMAVRAGIL